MSTAMVSGIIGLPVEITYLLIRMCYVFNYNKNLENHTKKNYNQEWQQKLDKNYNVQNDNIKW
jgi:uncharacterized ion transporter superfamily protein YfcC